VNEKILRPVLFAAAAALHAIIIFFLVFSAPAPSPEAPENARVMKLTDIAEVPPPPPPPETVEAPLAETIAETMIETDTPPEQTLVAAGTLLAPSAPPDEYLPAHKVAANPSFDLDELSKDIVYPAIARRSGIEGRVVLELFVDRSGLVQQIRVLQENPPDRGFAEAAVRAFSGRQGRPAIANGEPVSCRFRYPVTFRLN
jgi:protein TonB